MTEQEQMKVHAELQTTLSANEFRRNAKFAALNAAVEIIRKNGGDLNKVAETTYQWLIKDL